MDSVKTEQGEICKHGKVYQPGQKVKITDFFPKMCFEPHSRSLQLCPMLASAVGKRLVNLVYKMGIMACPLLDTCFPKQA